MEKAHKTPFPGHFVNTEEVRQKVHLDIIRKIDASFPVVSRYICTFFDDFSSFTFITLLRRKSDMKEALKGLAGFLESSQQTKIRSIGLHLDGALGYKASPIIRGMVKINKIFFASYTFERIRIAVRVSRSITDPTQILFIQISPPVCLRPFAVKQALFVRNCVPHSATGKSPTTLLK